MKPIMLFKAILFFCISSFAACHSLDVKTRDKYGQQPLIKAAYKGDIKLVRKLLAHGAKVNARDKYGQTPLIRAAIKNHVAVARLLLQRKAKMNLQDKKGYTALMWAAWYASMDVAQLLLMQGADFRIKNKTGNTVANLIAENAGNSPKIMKMINLLRKFGALSDADLARAVRANNYLHVKQAIAARANVNSTTSAYFEPVWQRDYYTPLMWAAYFNRVRIARLLLQHGALVNKKQKYGSTALDVAIMRTNTTMIRLLKAHGGTVCSE